MNCTLVSAGLACKAKTMINSWTILFSQHESCILVHIFICKLPLEGYLKNT